jgi:hypothetical protein
MNEIEAAFHIGYASAVQTASDLLALNGADPEDWMRASRNVLTATELAELAQYGAQILARRGGTAVAA